MLANNEGYTLKKGEYSKAYKKWLQMSEEEKQGLIEPRKFDIPKTRITYSNPLSFMRNVGGGATYSSSKFSLSEVIGNNIVTEDQGDTDLCWAYASLTCLETNLALKRVELEPIEYDFSEKHMAYATVAELEGYGGQKNIYGINRDPLGEGNFLLATTYLTNGLGAVYEEDFEADEEMGVSWDDVFSLDAETQVKDIVYFPQYQIPENLRELDDIKMEIKKHVVKNGSVGAYVHATDVFINPEIYNKETGAIYCDDNTQYLVDHAVSIIGWDDEYSKTNFAKEPKEDGAWIVLNSWGERYIVTEEEAMKWVKGENFDPETITDEDLEIIDKCMTEQLGFQRDEENEVYYIPVGKNSDGIMYISYEDVNIYSQLYGIEKATDEIEYEQIYQYNETECTGALEVAGTSKAMLANVFEKKTEGQEYLTEVSFFAIEQCTCKVFVNLSGDNLDNLESVNLKDGESEVIKPGYHTLEFATPLEITGQKFVVAIEIEGTRNDSLYIILESKNANIDPKTETGKCFLRINNGNWMDASHLKEINPDAEEGDTSIKAFTVSEAPDNSFSHIEIKKEPNKKIYVEGEQFDPTGMEVIAFYNDGTY